MLAALIDGEKIKHRESLGKDQGGKNHKEQEKVTTEKKNRKGITICMYVSKIKCSIIHTKHVRCLLAFICKWSFPIQTGKPPDRVENCHSGKECCVFLADK